MFRYKQTWGIVQCTYFLPIFLHSLAEAIKDGCADIICSDYFPQAILHSIFIMAEKYGCPLPEVVKKSNVKPCKGDEDRCGLRLY